MAYPMCTKELLVEQIDKLPESLLEKVLEYIRLLQTNLVKEKIETLAISESALKKDWLKPEEDEAWQNL
jgi:hypothetical protein